MSPPVRALALSIACLAGPAQDSAGLFTLRLPGWFEQTFPGGLIEVPDRPLERLQLQVRETEERGIGYGNIFVKINGKGAGNLFDRRPSIDGIVLTMDPERLRLRPDPLIDPYENAVEIVAQDRRGRRYYQNWIIRTRQHGRNGYFAYAGAVSPQDPQGSPPDVILEQPTSPPVIGPAGKSIQVRLKGLVSSAAPGIVVTLNGRKWLAPAVGNSQPFDETITVTRDTREVVIEATDSKGHRRSVTVPVILRAAGPPKPRFAGQRYAVVIGVSRFGDETRGALPILPGAAAEARLFASGLASAGFPADNLLTLIDEQATREQVRAALTSFAGRAQANDFLLVYISTYGLHDHARPERLHLALHGTQTKALGSTSLDFEELELILNRNVRSNHAVFIFDVDRDAASDPPATRNLINRYVLNLFSEQDGRAVLVSGSAGQPGIGGSGGPGVFSSTLAEALSGTADTDGDRIVTTAELFRYVTEQVRQRSDAKQAPRYALPARLAEESPWASPVRQK